MDTRQRTTLAVAGVVAAGAGALYTIGSQADAQPQVAIAPHVVTVTTEAVAWNTDVNQQVQLTVNQLLMIRTWSDGLVEYAKVTNPSSGTINFTSWQETGQ